MIYIKIVTQIIPKKKKEKKEYIYMYIYIYPILDTRISVLLLLRHAQGTPHEI